MPLCGRSGSDSFVAFVTKRTRTVLSGRTGDIAREEETPVNDMVGSPVQGRTRWRRFAVVAVAATAAAGAIVVGMANGAIAASFAVSGQTFKVSADKLTGTGFVQYGGVVKPAGQTNPVPVAESGIASADLTNLCQSVVVPNTPISMIITAGQDPKNPAHADNLLIDMSDLTGDATFTNINIGQDASTLTAAGPNAHGQAGAFGQSATGVEIDNLHQISWATTAGTFALRGLHLSISLGDSNGKAKECF
jgi:hypothetical protein